MSILSIAHDINPVQVARGIGDIPTSPIPLGDPAMLLALCDDGAMLAVRVMDAGEFLHGIRTGTLFSVGQKLRDHSPWAYVVIIGDLAPSADGHAVHDGRKTGWHWAAIQGALLTLQESGVCTLRVKNEVSLQDVIESLADRSRSPVRIRPPRDALFISPAEDLLMALPGIGDERCEALLRQCGSAAWALVALCDDGPDAVHVPGVGPETKQKIRAALGLTDNLVFTIHVKEQSDEHQHRTHAPGADADDLADDQPGLASGAPVAALRHE